MGAEPIPRGPLVAIDGDGRAQVGADGTLWPYTQNAWWPWRSTRHERVDPINAIVVHTTPDAVHRLLGAAGWARPDDGAVHQTWARGGFVRMHDHIALGDRSERVHVRLFALDGHTLAAAHHEVADPTGHHVVTSWDRARQVLGAALVAAGMEADGSVDPVTTVDVRGVDGDGRIWRYVRGGR